MLRHVTLFIYTSRLTIYRTIKPPIQYFSAFRSSPVCPRFEAFPNKGRLTTFLTRRIIPKNANTAFIIFWLQNHDNLIISGMMGNSLTSGAPLLDSRPIWGRKSGVERMVWLRRASDHNRHRHNHHHNHHHHHHHHHHILCFLYWIGGL